MGGADAVAIVGMAGLFPGAATVEAFWDNIRSGFDAITDVPKTRWDPVFFDAEATGADRFYCRRGGFVDDLASFDPLAHAIMPNAVGAIEPDQLLALAAAATALDDADGAHERVDPAKVSVILGRGGYLGDGVARLDQRVRTAQQLVEALRILVPEVGEDRLAQVKAEFQAQLGPEQPESSIGLVPNLAASRIANRFDLRGPAYTVDAACASSLLAVDQGVAQLRGGSADLVLAGGVHHCHDLTLWSVFCQLQALSPTEVIAPFSREADGILVGEGTGMFVLKRLADAERDDDRIYAVIAGTGSASDGAGASLMNPRSEGQVLAVSQAWRASGLDPAAVGLIEAHGTATPVGDRTEVETLRTVFGDDLATRPVLGSVKSMIGHAMPAAGAAGLAKAAMAIYHGELPPTLHAPDPNPALVGSSFRLIDEVEPWEGTGPRLAGVNAFGFGGINAHVVLRDHPSSRAPSTAKRRRSPRQVSEPEQHEELILLAGADAADLLGQLEAWEPGGPLTVPTDGPARLAVVAPNERRLTLARKVLERGTAFRGRNDVWFDPGTERGELAFLFPGVEPTFEPRVDDVAEQFGIDWEGLADDVPPLERQGRGLVAVGRLLAEALERMGIRPDVIAGHSLGEWTGQIVSGMIPDSYVDEFLEGLQPGTIEVSDVVFVALGAGADTAAELVDGLDGAHVSHDNCPHQSVICAPAAQMDVAVQRAREAKVLAQELPFRSGFHSPLFAPFVPAMAAQFGSIPLVAAATPLWSATSTEPYPDEPEAISELSGRHLVEPVRFRELTEALHDSGVRTFVQVGTGSLGGFVDDTLRDRPATTVSANVAKQTGVGQLRRVGAAVWATGIDVDFAPLGHDVAPPAPADATVPLVLGSTLVRDLTPLESRPPSAERWDDLDAPGPLVDEFRETVAEAEAAALAVLRAARQPVPSVRETVPSVRETVHTLSVGEQPYWLDHAFYEQPQGWPVVEDLFPLVPMTAIIEMLMAEAEALAPGSVATAVHSVRAFKWLAVQPPTSVTVRATRDDDGSVRTSIDRHARATVELAPQYPPAPAPAARPVHGEIDCPVTPEHLYEQRHLFHGPSYQGLLRFDEFGSDGASGLLETKDYPGSLLDNAGQLFGFWLAQRVDRDRLVLPTSIDRISFYGPRPEPGTAVRCVVNCTELGEVAVRADLELTVDGRVWCVIEGWEDRRFQSDDRLFAVLRQPSDRPLGEPQPGGWVLVREGWPDSASRDVVMRRFLGIDERSAYDARNPNVQRVWLLGRIAAKDAVRELRWRDGAGPLFPVEVTIDNDPEGRPLAHDHLDGDVHVSIAHTDGFGVAIASSSQPVGIDIERIEDRPETFAATALSESEQARFAGLDQVDDPTVRARELTRWWAAKEAAAKAAGTGMQGRPADWEVADVDGDRLRIGDRWLGTALVETTHVVAWTEIDEMES